MVVGTYVMVDQSVWSCSRCPVEFPVLDPNPAQQLHHLLDCGGEIRIRHAKRSLMLAFTYESPEKWLSEFFPQPDQIRD